MPVFLSGKVMLDDGTPPPEPVTIERICNGGSPRPEGYTDSKGRFSIQLGQNTQMLADASVGNGSDDPFARSGGGMGMPGMSSTRGVSESALMTCEIRASLPGFRGQAVSLAGRRFMDNPDIGTIILKRLGKVEGRTTSMTTLEAPKEAKKSFEKAINSLKKKKDSEAEKELEKAVEIYPKFAAAWYELGVIRERANQVEPAKDAYQKALAADAKFIKPYMQLAGLAAKEAKWQDVADTTDRVIKLDPFDYPGAYFYNAVANYNLQKMEPAEKSAREGLKQDEQHRLPKLAHILGIILAEKNDLTGAAEHMKLYLKFAPQAKDADLVRNQLSQVEKMSASAKNETAEPKPQP
ncbi:MAG: tetratricopeptide repeat protein [Acidobacteria bacterium]|nr:tetratricopeptide repeat protein [Acidobacteriota bacterium]